MLLPLALFYHNGVVELRAEEPRRAIVALEMYLSGNYLVPKINGWDYYNKPPLFNWLIAASYWLFGSFSEWVVRVPAMLSFLLTGLLHYLFGRKYLGGRSAFYAALFFLTAADLFFYATINTGEIDLFYALLVYLQVMCIFIGEQKNNYLLVFAGSYFLTALGVLTKGPPSVLFQGITLLAWLVYTGNGKKLFSRQHAVGIALFVVVAGGYFYAYAQQADVEGLVMRLTKEATQRSGLEGSLWRTLGGAVSFPFRLLQLLLPWSVFVYVLFRRDLRARIAGNPLLAFSAVFIVTNIPVYWFTAELRNRYIYMFFPFITTLLAYFLQQPTLRLQQITGWMERVFLFAMAVAPVAFLALPFLPFMQSVQMLWLWAIVFMLLTGVLAFGYYKNKEQRLLWALLYVVVFRFALDVFYLPVLTATSKNLVYRQRSAEILAITKNDVVYWAEQPYTFTSELKAGPLRLKEATHTTAALLCYELPYYLTRSNGHIMQFDTVLQPGRFYITTPEFIEGRNLPVLYQLHDTWTQRELVLVKP